MGKKRFREEKDALGTVEVPEDAYFGAGTQRAVDNFPISGLNMPIPMIRALALVKKGASRVNQRLGLLEEKIAEAIADAAQEVMEGGLDDQFVVDVFQTGSGTSTNMNMNEVIASRANEILTGKKGGKSPVHPNDHVNLGQSSNDVIPSAIHISARQMIQNDLLPSLALLQLALSDKASQFSKVKKIGRTHLQDAVPMSLGQEFSGYCRQVDLGIKRIESASRDLEELALGGTAVGTGLNAHPEFAETVIRFISDQTGIRFRKTENHFEAQGARDAVVFVSGALKTLAVSMVKIANDIRWLGSGPRCGLGEIVIPSLQPGSSIMPGKINPVIPEAVVQVAAQVMGNDTAIMLGGQGGNFELNAMLPVIAHNLLQSIQLLSSVATIFAQKCIQGLTADERICSENIDKSLALATYLVPDLGYDRASRIAKQAHETGRTVKEIAVEENILSEADFNRLLKDL